MLTLEEAAPADWPLWREVRLAALTEAPESFKARLEDWERGGEEQWRARLELPGAYNVLALLDGRPVGVVRGVPDGRGGAELRSLYAAPSVRGRGVGDRLMEAVESWALREGIGELRLAVLPDNARAQALYRRRGFAPTGETGDLLPGGERERVMAKRLG
ncbi:GNAT family N-acetyltransferase [Streptomyces sp. ODS28]|uniref:GNAT family N-acetyltransferase n=1 Tax=Streptomyces sp. ODS28 TaxID=3136688 RepID=UPI0031E509FA